MRLRPRRCPGLYRIEHRDAKRQVLTLERADYTRHWTPYSVVTVESTYGFISGALVEFFTPGMRR